MKSVRLILKEISGGEHDVMNMHPPSPFNGLVTALREDKVLFCLLVTHEVERKKFDDQKVSKDHLDLVLAVDANNDLQLFCSSRYKTISLSLRKTLERFKLVLGKLGNIVAEILFPVNFFFVFSSGQTGKRFGGKY